MSSSITHCRLLQACQSLKGQDTGSPLWQPSTVVETKSLHGSVSRRTTLSALALLLPQLLNSGDAVARQAPKAPEKGACVECIGEVNGGLNACTLASPSCVSTQNDDEAHFLPPWQYSGNMQAAVEDLVNVATGVRDVTSRKGYSTAKAESEARNGRDGSPSNTTQESKRFNGRLESRHTTEDGSEYLHFVLGSNPLDTRLGNRNLGTIDAEFIFLSGDNIVDIRTASREKPGLNASNLTLSLSYGVQYDKNIARREMEAMRQALRWEQTPVVTDFDPRFNQKRPLFFEKLYQPFLREKQNFEDIVDK